MCLHRLSLLVLSSALACTMANSGEPELEIANSVDACINFSSPRARSDGNLRLLELNVVHMQSTASCGCKSALLSYRVTEVVGAAGLNSEMASGRISGLESSLGSTALLVIDTDQSIQRRGPRTLKVGCAAPE